MNTIWINEKGQEIAVRIVKEMPNDKVLVQKTTATGNHGVFKISADKIIVRPWQIELGE